jgi:hypothetical protein
MDTIDPAPQEGDLPPVRLPLEAIASRLTLPLRCTRCDAVDALLWRERHCDPEHLVCSACHVKGGTTNDCAAGEWPDFWVPAVLVDWARQTGYAVFKSMSDIDGAAWAAHIEDYKNAVKSASRIPGYSVFDRDIIIPVQPLLKCTRCDAPKKFLWREYNTFANHLVCSECHVKAGTPNGSNKQGRPDWWLPAVVTDEACRRGVEIFKPMAYMEGADYTGHVEDYKNALKTGSRVEGYSVYSH